MIEVDAALAIHELSQMMLRAAYPQPMFNLIGRSEVENIRGLIQRDKRSPEGQDWAPWAPYTQDQREKKGNAEQGLLWDRGDLLNSIRFEAGHDELQIGSDEFYAGFLQDGTSKMPAREYMGWSEHSLPFYEMAWMEYLQTGNA